MTVLKTPSPRCGRPGPPGTCSARCLRGGRGCQDSGAAAVWAVLGGLLGRWLAAHRVYPIVTPVRGP
jgi:hypothetical protein